MYALASQTDARRARGEQEGSWWGGVRGRVCVCEGGGACPTHSKWTMGEKVPASILANWLLSSVSSSRLRREENASGCTLAKWLLSRYRILQSTCKTRQGKSRQGKARQGKARQSKRQGKTTQVIGRSTRGTKRSAMQGARDGLVGT